MINTCDGQDCEINQSDCCGNGCANCILDIKPQQFSLADDPNKKNIIAKYVKFKVMDKCAHTKDTPDIIEIHFGYVDATIKKNDYILRIPSGHHIMMRAPLDPPIVRPYSPFWMDAIKMEFKILVNLKPQGEMSRYISNLKLGDEVEFRGPVGKYWYTIDNSSTKCIYIISQGVAISPTIPIIEEILRNEDDMSRIIHLACFTDLAHIYFRDCLHEFNKYWNYKSYIYLAHELCDSMQCIQNGNCIDGCEKFLKRLRYKEIILTCKLDEMQLGELYNSRDNNVGDIIIISGARNFQNTIVEWIKKLELPISNENIYVL